MEVHTNVFVPEPPVTMALSCEDPPATMDGGVAVASTLMFTLTFAVSLAVCVPEVATQVYVVVMTGEAVGFCWVEVNPGGTEVHAYV
jgi:hypothetical protein